MKKISLFFIVFSLLFMVKIDVLAKVDTKGTNKGASLENAKK